MSQAFKHIGKRVYERFMNGFHEWDWEEVKQTFETEEEAEEFCKIENEKYDKYAYLLVENNPQFATPVVDEYGMRDITNLF